MTTRSAGKGGKGGSHPSNVLQDNFSNSSNSGAKIAGGGGGKADDLGNYNMHEYYVFYNLAILRAFSHDLCSIDSNFFLVPKPPNPCTRYASRFAYLTNIASEGRKSRFFHKRGEKTLVVGYR